MLSVREEDEGGRIAASWTTTGEVFRIAPRRRHRWRFPFLRRKSKSAAASREPQLWQAVAILLTSIAFLVALVAALAFLIAWLVTGAAY
jgi:hypothetical protein